MGYEDRLYARDNWSPRRNGPNRSSRGFAGWEVWKKLIAINIAVFLLQIFFTRPATEADLYRLPYADPELYYEHYSNADNSDQADSEQDPESNQADKNADTANGDAADTKGEGEHDEAQADAASKSERSDAETGEMESKKPRGPTPQELRERYREEILPYMPRISIVQQWLELDSEKVKQGQVWRLITAGFCHDRMAIWHLLINMLFLYWFGKRLERVFGPAEFTAFYFTALLFASIAYIALDLYTQKNIPAIGASGAVWGVTALYALMYPYERIYIYFLFPVEIRWLVLLYFIFDLHPVLLALSGDSQFTGVAHAAHIGGAIFGFLYWHQGWRLMPIIDRFRGGMPRRKPPPRGSKESPELLALSSATEKTKTNKDTVDRLDEILQKISRQGRESLTDEELAILEETSRKIREDRRGES